jgi:hypothetical protein
MADLVNEFSWSKTRDESMRKCPRRYYFHYYGSWGGWENDCPVRTRRIYVLKQLVTRAMWAGAKVHDCIKKSLRNTRRGIEPMPEDEAIETTLAIMRSDYANSRRGDYWKNPKSCGFFEHEYGIDLPDNAWKETADHVVRCLKTFYSAPLFETIRALPPDRWLDVEDYSSFQLDGVKVHVVLDFSYRGDDGGIVIYDWKTGRSDSERNEIQLACYTFYASEKWNAPPDKITTIEFNLASGREVPYLIKGVGLDSILQYIRGSMRDMQVLLDDPAANTATEERFAYTPNESVCGYCNFRKICPKWADEQSGGA